ncbi:MAG: NAD(P)-dependent oxidoreductase [Gammaproteobacteria bacterium]|nr:NAD(P)-dependent oxidoreductase [Gammaproteobacteria bacterium]
MKHIIFGGDGFLGTELTRKLTARGEQVLICDRKQTPSSGIYKPDNVRYLAMDVRDKDSFAAIPVESGDIVYHFAAELLVPIIKRADRKDYFWQALYVGTQNVLDFMQQNGLRNLIYFTTDMVYGHTLQDPRTEDHPRAPLGPYGEAKYRTELLCEDYRTKGFNIPIFRPRLIIGPGRLGILEKLFKLIDMNLPVPTIGNGKNYYQFISVSDCAEACLSGVAAGFPNEAYNLGSLNPPTVNELLKTLIKEAGSRSFLIPTPASAVKFVLATLDRFNIPLMDPEQYLIADETCVLDVSKGERDLNWVPKDHDTDMLLAAYRSYRNPGD